ncbi:MAG: HEAT repeat domain-containing protein [Rubripirellula sp.]
MNPLFQDSFEALLQNEVDPVAAGIGLRDLSEKAEGRALELLEQLLVSRSELANTDPAIVGTVLRILHASLLREGWSLVESLPIETIVQLEQAIPPRSSNRFLLQQLYAVHQSDQALIALVESLSLQPPQKWVEAAQVLSPLMQRSNWSAEAFFPNALGLLQHPSLASPLLDLANFLYRKELTSQHPANNQVEMLRILLGEVVGRLGAFEDDPRTFGTEVPIVQARLAEAVALAVSLCDALALMGDLSSIGKLHQAMELRHRRVQSEAAGALARLGDDQGKARLLELLKEPAARLRVIQYAEELGFGEEVESEFRTANATSEAELALWLSQPQQMGVPPTHVEVVHTTRCLWPSYHDPVDISLVKFEYNFGEKSYSNIGMTGPVTFAMSVDVTDLSLEDTYAIYAGWHAEHDEIFTLAPENWNDLQREQLDQWKKHLERCGFEQVKAVLLGRFLDETAGIYTASRQERSCLVITDGLESIEHLSDGAERSMGPLDIFNLYKGRKMLRTFNPDRDLVPE